MNILFVSITPIEYNSSANIQNMCIIKGLKKLGHSVDILTSESAKNISYYDASFDVYEDCKIFRLKQSSAYSSYRQLTEFKKEGKLAKLLKTIKILVNKIYKIANVYEWVRLLIKDIPNIEFDNFDYDIILSASDPKASHLLAIELKNLFPNSKGKWVQYWGDPMYADITLKKNIKKILVKREEKRLIKFADRIIYSTPFTLEAQKKLYPEHSSKMSYVHQGYIERPLKLIESNSNGDKKNIIMSYAGSYPSAIRNIIPLYEAMEHLNNVRLNICGKGDMHLSNTKNVKILDMLPFNEVSELEKESDIIICLCNNRGTQIPGKVYYTANYNKPIIIILDGELQDEMYEYFSKFNRYILCKNNKKSIIEAVTNTIESYNSLTYAAPSNLSPEAVAQYILDSVSK